MSEKRFLSATPYVMLLTVMAVITGFPTGYQTSIISGAMLVIRQQFKLTDQWQELIVSVTVLAAAIFALFAGWFNEKFGRKLVIMVSCVIFILSTVLMASATDKIMLLIGRLILGIAIGHDYGHRWFTLVCMDKELYQKQAFIGIVVIINIACNIYSSNIGSLGGSSLGKFETLNPALASSFAGLSTSTVPAYMAETMPTNIRGILLTLFPVLITFGQWIAGIASAAFSYITDGNISWRVMIAFGCITLILQVFNFRFMPESPHWLARHKRLEDADKVLDSIYNRDDNEKAEIQASLRQMEVSSHGSEGGRSGIVQLLKNREARKALMIGCSLQMFQQLSGVNCVMFYAASIMKMAGIRDDTLAMWLGSLSGLTNFIGTSIGAYLIERLGRRISILFSTAGSVAGLLIMGISFCLISDSSMPATYDEGTFMGGAFASLSLNDSCRGFGCGECSYMPECGFCYSSNEDPMGSCVHIYRINDREYTDKALYGRCSVQNASSTLEFEQKFLEPNAAYDYGFCVTQYSWLPIMALVIFIASFSLGLSGVPWTVNGEIYPSWARSSGNSAATFTNWLFCLITALSFLSVSRAITRQGIFFLYAALSTVGFCFMYLFLPETKGIDFEQIESLLAGPWIYKPNTILDGDMKNRKRMLKTTMETDEV